MGKLEKILEIVSLIFGVFYYICEYATKKKNKEDAEDCPKAIVEGQDHFQQTCYAEVAQGDAAREGS